MSSNRILYDVETQIDQPEGSIERERYLVPDAIRTIWNPLVTSFFLFRGRVYLPDYAKY